MVLNDCKKRHTNLGMGWIDYKKAYDMIPDSMILESLGLEKCLRILWNLSKNQCLANVTNLSPLLFVIGRTPLTQILKKSKTRVYLDG